MAIVFETHEGVARITINRPDVMNAMDPATYAEITEAFGQIEDDPGIAVGIVTGAGDKAFTAGADLKTMHTAGRPALRSVGSVAARTGGTSGRPRPSRWSRPSTGTPSPVAWSWPWSATSASPPRTPCSARRR